MFIPNNQEEFRANFFLVKDNLEQTMVETIRMLNINFIRSKILVFSYKKYAMIVWSPGAYTKIVKCTVQENKEKMQLDLLSYHDSCWTEGVNKFIVDLLEDFTEQFSKNPNLCSFDFRIRTMDIIEMDSLPKDLQKAIRYLDHGFNNCNDRKKSFKVDYCRDLFPLMTHEMQRVEKQDDNRN